jgi:hypothetical protein
MLLRSLREGDKTMVRASEELYDCQVLVETFKGPLNKSILYMVALSS